VNHSYDFVLERHVVTQKLNPNPSNLDILNYLANLGEGKSDHKTEAFLDIMAAMRRSCMTHSCGDYCQRAYPQKKKKKLSGKCSPSEAGETPKVGDDSKPGSSSAHSKKFYCRFGFHGAGKALRSVGKILRTSWNPSQKDMFRFECARNTPKEQASDVVFLYNRANMDCSVIIMDEAAPDYILKYKIKGEKPSDMCKYAAQAAAKLGDGASINKLIVSVSIRSAREREIGGHKMVMRLDPQLPMVQRNGPSAPHVSYKSSFYSLTVKAFAGPEDKAVTTKHRGAFELYLVRPKYFTHRGGGTNDSDESDDSHATESGRNVAPSSDHVVLGNVLIHDINSSSPENKSECARLDMLKMSADLFYKMFTISNKACVTERFANQSSSNPFYPLQVLDLSPTAYRTKCP
jgi:hypothetical protein